MEINKIYLMDCLEFLKQIKDDEVDLIIADYPFNCQDGRSNYKEFITETANEFFRILKLDKPLIIINNPPNIFRTVKCYEKFYYRNGIVLLRKGALRPTYHFGFQHNYCIVFLKAEDGKADIKKVWNGTKVNHDATFLTDVIEYQNGYRGMGEKWHPQAIPLDLTMKFIELFSNDGDLVLDCFMGSGTSAIASKKLNRNFIGCEINEEYFKMAQDRIRVVMGETKLSSFMEEG